MSLHSQFAGPPRTCLTLLTLAALTLSACGSAAAGTPAQGLRLPAPHDIPRTTSAIPYDIPVLARAGAEFVAELPHKGTQANLSELLFQPAFEEDSLGLQNVSYALYRLQPGAYDGPASINLEWAAGQAPKDDGEVFVGVANYSSNSWDWFELPRLPQTVQPPISSIELPALADYLLHESELEAGALHVALLCTGQPVTLRQLALGDAQVFPTLAINLNPVIEAEDNKRLHEVAAWFDPYDLQRQYREDYLRASAGWANYFVVETIDHDFWPLKADGFSYDDDSYLACLNGEAEWHMPDSVSYEQLINDFYIRSRINVDQIDEVWFWGHPYSGFYESQMVGPTAYWCNSPEIIDPLVERNFVIMGLNFERGYAEQLHSFGHRAESIMAHVYGSWNTEPQHNWDHFARLDKDSPGLAGIGNVHFPPNGEADYDYSNPREVLSSCDDWLNNWPDLTGETKSVTCEEWGCDHWEYMKWWLSHMPHQEGINADSKQNNWWKYLVDFNSYEESK